MPQTLSYPPASYIDPHALMQIRSLELRAKAVVEGFFAGMHRSPYHGFSVEFTEYRQYVPGDDPRYLDWRLYARSDRYFVKRFEDETNLRCHLLLDTSRSMTFGKLPYTKADYAKTLAATQVYPEDAAVRDPAVTDLPQPRIHLIDAATGEIRETLVSPQCFAISAAFSPDGKTLATSGEGRVLLWDLPAPPGLAPAD
jgi:hypothetical protein